MDDTKTMLRAIINGQSAMKSELLSEIRSLDKKIDDVNSDLNDKIDGVEVRLTKRIDMIGRQVANLEDDAPTRDEFDDLESRVQKVEQEVAPV